MGEQLFHCHECYRLFMWELVKDTPHWSSSVMSNDSAPQYCPCCGAFHAIGHGEPDGHDGEFTEAASS